MASNNVTPEKEASKWFVLTMIGCILYISAAFGFVILRDVEPTSDQIEVPSHD